MYTHTLHPLIHSVSPVLMSAALDCLGAVPELDPDNLDDMRLIGRALGATPIATLAIAVRLTATTCVMSDPRWLSWMRFVAQRAENRRLFHRCLSATVCICRLDASGRFDLDDVFDTLLHMIADPSVIARHIGTSPATQ